MTQIAAVVVTYNRCNMLMQCIEHIHAQSVAIISYLDPVIAVLLSIFVLGEGMNVIGIIGAVLVLGAALMSELEK